jgi:hypothetical protein
VKVKASERWNFEFSFVRWVPVWYLFCTRALPKMRVEGRRRRRRRRRWFSRQGTTVLQCVWFSPISLAITEYDTTNTSTKITKSLRTRVPLQNGLLPRTMSPKTTLLIMLKNASRIQTSQSQVAIFVLLSFLTISIRIWFLRTTIWICFLSTPRGKGWKKYRRN